MLAALVSRSVVSDMGIMDMATIDITHQRITIIVGLS